jgi:hypothetical protein
MLNADVLTFQEFITLEHLPLSTIHEAILEFLKGREAVNEYASEPRMTQVVDLLSIRAKVLAEELRHFFCV